MSNATTIEETKVSTSTAIEETKESSYTVLKETKESYYSKEVKSPIPEEKTSPTSPGES